MWSISIIPGTVTALGFIPGEATLLLCEPIRELSAALPELFVGTESQLMQNVRGGCFCR